MTDRRARMIEDRHLRDSARALVEADVHHLRSDLSNKGLAARAFDKVREGAVEVYEEAVDVASDNKGALAALIAAILVWFARNPLIDLFDAGSDAPEEGNAEADVRPEHDAA